MVKNGCYDLQTGSALFGRAPSPLVATTAFILQNRLGGALSTSEVSTGSCRSSGVLAITNSHAFLCHSFKRLSQPNPLVVAVSMVDLPPYDPEWLAVIEPLSSSISMFTERRRLSK
jgi:hypothetical protein